MASKEATKLIGGILNWTVSYKTRILAAMNTNAQWEIWLQVEMSIYLKGSGNIVIREQRYDDSRKSLDILAKMGSRAFAIELKAESLQTGRVSGATMYQALSLDKKKLEENGLLKKVKDMNCTELSLIVIGIGQASKYQKIALKVMQQGTPFAANIHNEFGVYGFLMET